MIFLFSKPAILNKREETKTGIKVLKTGSINVVIDSAGATHRGLLQRPVHRQDRPAEALHPRRMPHHLRIRTCN